MAIRWQPIQLEAGWEANHRALRRCHGCGVYARLVEQVEGALRCPPCAEKARQAHEAERRGRDATEINFLL